MINMSQDDECVEHEKNIRKGSFPYIAFKFF